MRNRRWLYIAAAVAATALIALVMVQTGPFAQEGAPPPPGPDGGMGPGGPGMPGDPMMGGPPGGGAAGGGMEWKTYDPPEELTITYQEFLSLTGESRADIPNPFITKDDGTPAKHTKNEWHQLQRLYASQGDALAGPVEGRVGKSLLGWFEPWAATKISQGKALLDCYQAGQNIWTFEVGAPVSAGMTFDVTTGSVTDVNNIIIPVVMRVKPSASKNYPALVYRKLKKFDSIGHGRDTGSAIVTSSAPFRIFTQQGGMWRPNILNLEPEMGPLWMALWSAGQIRLTLFDPTGKEIATAMQTAGHDGSILQKVVYPDIIYHQPRHKLLIPPEGLKFGGGKWHVAGTRGWVFAFSFNMTAAQARSIHRAKAEYVGVENVDEMLRGRMSSATMPAPPTSGAASPTAGGAGEPGMPGGEAMPGAPPGAPGMPPP